MARKQVCMNCDVISIIMLNSKYQGFGKVSNFDHEFSMIKFELKANIFISVKK